MVKRCILSSSSSQRRNKLNNTPNGEPVEFSCKMKYKLKSLNSRFRRAVVKNGMGESFCDLIERIRVTLYPYSGSLIHMGPAQVKDMLLHPVF
jgi:hypothetical protein